MMPSFFADALTISDVEEVLQHQLMDQPERSAMPGVPVMPYMNNAPYVRIIEQPASKNLRFRYECEGRSAGSIVGANSTPENRTHPTIQVVNYQGPFAVVVSTVTKEGPPYRPHPHNLVGRENCKLGIFTLPVNNPDMTYSFTSLGIQCVKKKDIEKSLQQREDRKVDPFGTGFSHRNQPGSIDLNVVRLCFQVFIKGPDNTFSQPLPPVVSDPIYDKKAMSDLTVMKLSHYSAAVCGGTEVILLCDRVAKEDIQVWFFEEQDSQIVWESQADFQPSDVHKQVAIAFKTPRYYNENIQQPVQVFIELRKPSERLRGDPRPFQFLPIERDPEGLVRKRQKIEESCLDRYLQENALPGGSMAAGCQMPIAVPRTLKSPRQRIKAEPVMGATGGEQFPVASCSVEQYPLTVSPGSTTPYLTPVHSPALAMSPGSYSLTSVSPTSRMLMTSVPPLSQASSSSSHNNVCDTAEHGNLTQNANAAAQASIDDAVIEKFDSLGLDIDPSELTNFNLNLPENLSTSLFDSANNLIETPLDAPLQSEDQNMPSEESLNRICRIQNELVELSKLCKNTESS